MFLTRSVDDEASSSGSEEPMDISEDTTTMLKHFNGDISTPPDATSTPMRSMQIPAQMQSQSSMYPYSTKVMLATDTFIDLLEQDSEMQRAMRDLDSYDEESQSLQQRKCESPR